MLEEEKTCTKKRQMHHVPRETIYAWILKEWNETSSKIVHKSLRKYGISTSLDEIEGDNL